MSRVWSWWRAPQNVVPAALLAIFVAGRAVMLAGGQLLVAPDSRVYALRDDPARDLGPLVSFTGHAPRPWGLPLFYALFVDDHTRTVAQWTVGTLAWAALAWELSRQLRTAVSRVAALAGVLGLALMNTVASWDFAILSESMSISVGLIVIALFLRWQRKRSTGYLVALVAFGVWWTFIRPDIRFFTVVLILLLAWNAWRPGRNRERPRSRIAAAAGAAVLALGIAWYAAITPAMMETFKAYDGDAIPTNPLPLDQEIFVHRLRTLVFTDPALLGTFHTRLQMPACPATERFAQRSDWATVEFAEAYVSCPDMVAWGNAHRHDFWGSLAKADPGVAARTFLQTTSYTLGGQIYASAPQVVPAPLERATFPSRQYGLAVAIAGLTVTFVLALFAGSWRNHRRFLLTGSVIGLASLASAMAAVWEGTGEYGRFGIQETIGTRLAMLVFVCCAIDSVLERRQEKRVPGGAEASAQAPVGVAADAGGKQ